MQVLVTGGAGYIGSHTAKVLSQRGLGAVALDDLSNGHRHNVRWGPLVDASIADTARVRGAIREHRIEAVVHFAAKAYVGESMAHPDRYFRTNVAGTLALLDALREEGVSKLVFSSTCATYGIPQRVPMGEDHPQRPVNPYGESKLFVERVLDWYGKAYGLRSVALRYFNAAGADPDAEIGEEHDPETHLIPLVLQTALGKRERVEVYGTDYPTPDGTAIRDYIHVTDLADAHLRALEYCADSGGASAFNLATGVGHSVREVIVAAERITGRTVRVRETARREGDPPALVADPQRAADVLGWRPRYSDLDTILDTAWRWHQKAS